ncbi:hypothetical protein Baya_12371 [Bagarius yarrelli]|uniref:Uncharacterized protein n=1 Tax=Bagarius yarrelli TaxID=175774 RepID=A0A556V2J4_BAGYA|nr:hypothetical protein Baya_12371 [Bagarius yarrelli]
MRSFALEYGHGVPATTVSPKWGSKAADLPQQAFVDPSAGLVGPCRVLQGAGTLSLAIRRPLANIPFVYMYWPDCRPYANKHIVPPLESIYKAAQDGNIQNLLLQEIVIFSEKNDFLNYGVLCFLRWPDRATRQPLRFAIHLCPSSLKTLGASGSLPSKPCRATAHLADKEYTANGGGGYALHAIAVLQVSQAKLLQDLGDRSAPRTPSKNYTWQRIWLSWPQREQHRRSAGPWLSWCWFLGIGF